MIKDGQDQSLKAGDDVTLTHEKSVFLGTYKRTSRWFKRTMMVVEIPKNINDLLPYKNKTFKVAKR